MVLKESEIDIEGRKIKLKQISFIKRMELLGKDEWTLANIVKASVSEEDFKFLNEIGDAEILLKEINKLNGWKEDFQIGQPAKEG